MSGSVARPQRPSGFAPVGVLQTDKEPLQALKSSLDFDNACCKSKKGEARLRYVIDMASISDEAEPQNA